VQAQLETKKLTARAQQNSSLSPPRQQKTAKDRQETPKAQLCQMGTKKLRKPVVKQQNAPAAAKTESYESQTNNCGSQKVHMKNNLAS
jgi:hypothetical protein